MKKGGRPTKWKPEYNQQLIEHFSQPKVQIVKLKKLTKGKREIEVDEVIPTPMPKFYEFADKIGVDDDTLMNWAKIENKEKYPGFFGAYTRAKELQKWFLIDNTLAGYYEPRFAKFVAINVTDMADKVENSGPGGGPLQVNINTGSGFIPPTSRNSTDE